MARSALILLAFLALAMAGCGEDESELPEVATASICAATEDPPGDPVMFEGRVRELPHAPGDLGFVLSADGCAVLVAPPGDEGVLFAEGERVSVIGLIAPLDPEDVERIEFTLRDARGADGDSLRGAPITPGAPFLDAYSLEPRSS